jgi:hypothetical protein
MRGTAVHRDPTAHARRTSIAAIAAVVVVVLVTAVVAGRALTQQGASPAPRAVGRSVAKVGGGTPDHLFATISPWNTAIAKTAAVDPDSAQIVANVLNAPDLLVNLDLI